MPDPQPVGFVWKATRTPCGAVIMCFEHISSNEKTVVRIGEPEFRMFVSAILDIASGDMNAASLIFVPQPKKTVDDNGAHRFNMN